jgi:hypothetical protein
VVYLSEELDSALEDLSQAIQGIQIDESLTQIFPEESFTELYCAAVYLLAAIMDCLEALIKCVTRSSSCSPCCVNFAIAVRIFLDTPEIKKAKERVFEKVRLLPKEDDPEACRWFLSSEEYNFWRREGPPVLICTGKRMFLPDYSHG